jgi:hypothetical protein
VVGGAAGQEDGVGIAKTTCGSSGKGAGTTVELPAHSLTTVFATGKITAAAAAAEQNRKEGRH